jgi:hypothetical protein
MKWFIGFLILLSFACGYSLRMYQHPLHYQTEQERYEAGWYREYILSYVPPGYEKEEEKKPRTHIAPNPRLQPKLKKLVKERTK